MIEGISAVTLGTHEMPPAVRFYCALEFESCVATNNRYSPVFERG
jgi:hypothetical protein